MKYSRLFLTIAVAVMAGGSIMAQSTQKFTAAKHNEYGLVYSLPITHIKVQVEAEKTTKKAGPYCQYAKKYLAVNDAILENSELWTLKKVDMTSYGVPDPNNKYLMQFKAGSSPYLLINESGLPLSINIDNREEPMQLITGKGRTGSVLDDHEYGQSLPGELLVSESTAKRAEIAAQMIYKIRESRSNYATGEAEQMPPDGAAMKLVLDQLDKEEKNLMALFCGTTQTETAVKTFDYVPTGEVQKEVLFRLSDTYGIVDRDNLSGAPIYLSLNILERGKIPVNEKGEEKKLPKGAVMYKIPGKAEVTLKQDGKVILDKKFEVAQFGIDFGLDPSMFIDKKQPSFMRFYPETGGVKEIGVAKPSVE